MSVDCEFMQVTSFDGRIKLIKLPSILDPIQNEKTHAAAYAAATAAQNASATDLAATAVQNEQDL